MNSSPTFTPSKHCRAEIALVVVLMVCTFLAASIPIPLFSTATLEAFGFFSLFGFGGRLLRFYRTRQEPQVNLWQPMLLAVAMAVAAWASSFHLPRGCVMVLGFVPSVLLVGLHTGPWKRLMPASEPEQRRGFERNEKEKEDE